MVEAARLANNVIGRAPNGENLMLDTRLRGTALDPAAAVRSIDRNAGPCPIPVIDRSRPGKADEMKSGYRPI
jgi:hypothetical protein